MRLGLINSAWAQAGRETAWGLEKTKEIGFDCVDIFTDPLTIDARERRLIRTTCERLDLPIVSLCCVAVGLIDFNPSVQEFHVSRCEAFLDLAYEWDAENVLLVIGEYIWNREVIAPEEQWSTGVANCRRLAEYAADLGLQIALELEPFPLSLVNDVDTMVRFVDDVNHPAFRANIDVSHLLLSDVGPEQVAGLEDRAIHVHLSDCDGKVHGDLPPGHGVVPFEPYLAAIGELPLPDEAVVSIELEYSPEPDKIEEWVREAYTETAKLMQQAGLRG